MTETQSSLARLDALLAEVIALRDTTALLNWEERVCMPQGGVSAHGDMLATVRRLAHEKFTSAEVGRLIQGATAELNGDDSDPDARTRLAVAARDYEKAARVPADFVARHARI